mmetsp:Transcript_29021/g.50379  ORF Transcript_29021/g.50379 Transcript_29021/m.50379 type:complete len:231 (+) Transcript_29021:81-773(+)
MKKSRLISCSSLKTQRKYSMMTKRNQKNLMEQYGWYIVIGSILAYYIIVKSLLLSNKRAKTGKDNLGSILSKGVNGHAANIMEARKTKLEHLRLRQQHNQDKISLQYKAQKQEELAEKNKKKAEVLDKQIALEFTKGQSKSGLKVGMQHQSKLLGIGEVRQRQQQIYAEKSQEAAPQVRHRTNAVAEEAHNKKKIDKLDKDIAYIFTKGQSKNPGQPLGGMPTRVNKKNL